MKVTAWAKACMARAEANGVTLSVCRIRRDNHDTGQFPTPSGPVYWIGWIVRGEGARQGAGKEALEHFLQQCDGRNVFVRLQLDDDGSQKLQRLYEGLGFSLDPWGGDIMERRPGGRPQAAPRPVA